MPEGNTRNATVEPQNKSLQSLFGRLADELTRLFDAKLDLLKIELKEEVSAYTTAGLMILAGALIAVIGFALLNVAIAFLISMLFDATHWSQTARYALGFVLTAVLYLAVGAAVVIVAKNRLAKQRIIPKRTAVELKHDKQWLKEQI